MKRDEATAVLHADMCVHGPHTRTNVLHDMEDMKTIMIRQVLEYRTGKY